MNEERTKMSTTDQESKQKILNRLRRAKGQLESVINAVDDDRPCKDIVTQLAAVSSALDRAGFMIISTALRDCLSEEENPEGAENQRTTPEELEKLFLMLS